MRAAKKGESGAARKKKRGKKKRGKKGAAEKKERKAARVLEPTPESAPLRARIKEMQDEIIQRQRWVYLFGGEDGNDCKQLRVVIKKLKRELKVARRDNGGETTDFSTGGAAVAGVTLPPAIDVTAACLIETSPPPLVDVGAISD